jgi:shikimate dehydrogenase
MTDVAADRYLVVGNPIGHSRSPEIHAAFARDTGQAIRYERLLVPVDPPEAFDRAVRDFAAAGGRGLNVTLPFKERAFICAGSHGTAARLAGAVNTLSFRDDGLHGDNTDGPGLVTDLRDRLGIELRGRTVLLLGAGGAARGVVVSLLEAGVAALTVANRTPSRAEALAARFNGAAALREAGLPLLQATAFADAPCAEVIVNTTSSGVLAEGLALRPGLFRDCLLAYDCSYGRSESAFVAAALADGARRGADGLGMLVEQAAESFLIWRGVRPRTEPVYRMLRAALAAQDSASGNGR